MKDTCQAGRLTTQPQLQRTRPKKELTVVQACAGADRPCTEDGVTRQQQADKQQHECHVDQQVQLVGARDAV